MQHDVSTVALVPVVLQAGQSNSGGMRQTSKPTTLYSIQALRGLAALMVVFYHARYLFDSPSLERAFRNGAGGVDIFFVISGFVIYLTGRKLPPRTFMVRRIVRIVPLYWFFLTLKLVMALAGVSGSRSLNLSSSYILSGYFFTPAYDRSNEALPLIVAGWTLNFEMYFYLIAAAVLALRPKHFLALTSGAIIIGITVGIPPLLSGNPPAQIFILSPIALEFVAGMLLAAMWIRGIRLPLAATVLLLVVSVLWFAFTPHQGNYSILRVTIWGPPAIGIVLAALNLEERLSIDKATPLLLLGDSSYSLYLTHTAVLPLVMTMLRKLPPCEPIVGFTLLVVAATISGMVVHLLIEKPMVRHFTKLLGISSK